MAMVRTGRGKKCIDCTGSGDSFKEDAENARMIVRAVNCHEDLLEACRQLLLAYEELMPGVGQIAVKNYRVLNEAPLAAQAAIQKATGNLHTKATL